MGNLNPVEVMLGVNVMIRWYACRRRYVPPFWLEFEGVYKVQITKYIDVYMCV